jgi:hypothetical protein
MPCVPGVALPVRTLPAHLCTTYWPSMLNIGLPSALHRRSECRKESRLISRREQRRGRRGRERRADKTREDERERERRTPGRERAGEPPNTYLCGRVHCPSSLVHCYPWPSALNIGRVGCPLRCTGGANGGCTGWGERREQRAEQSRAEQRRGEERRTDRWVGV